VAAVAFVRLASRAGFDLTGTVPDCMKEFFR
jgi:hypothetical protein